MTGEKDKNNFPDKLKSEFHNIVFTILSIIQGFAFNQLATIFASNSDQIIGFSNIRYFFSFIISVLLIIRVFQTYMLAALHYSRWTVSFPDIVSIFIVGFIQYWIFDSLSTSDDSHKTIFYQRVFVLFIMASIIYSLVLYRIFKESSQIGIDFKREKIVQLINIFSPLLAVSLIVVSLIFIENVIITSICDSIIIVVIIINIYTSIHFAMASSNE